MPIEIDIMENEWLAEIFHQGEEQGLVKGRTEAARTILARQLERRFGPLPSNLARRIEAADPDTLERWSLQLMDSATVEETLR